MKHVNDNVNKPKQTIVRDNRDLYEALAIPGPSWAPPPSISSNYKCGEDCDIEQFDKAKSQMKHYRPPSMTVTSMESKTVVQKPKSRGFGSFDSIAWVPSEPIPLIGKKSSYTPPKPTLETSPTHNYLPGSSHTAMSSKSMGQQNDKNERPQCIECGIIFNTNHDYDKHIQTDQHNTAYEVFYRGQIDFERHRIFSSTPCCNVNEFLKSIESNFKVLVHHLILKNTAVLADINLVTLYQEQTTDVKSKSIASVKNFAIHNMVLAQGTDILMMYNESVDSFLTQTSALQNLGWALEELLCLEIIVVELLNINNAIELNSSVLGQKDNQENTEPKKCSFCDIFVEAKTFEDHNKSFSHQMAVYYWKDERIKVNGNKLEGCILKCQILSLKVQPIEKFFLSIRSHFYVLVNQVVQNQKQKPFSLNLKMYCHYNLNSLMHKYDSSSKFKIFIMNNLSLSDNMADWYGQISSRFQQYNSEYLQKTMNQSYCLVRVIFLQLDFNVISEN